MIRLFFYLLVVEVLFANTLHAQNPFKSIGVPDEEVKFLTLSQGRYAEFHKDNNFEIIGSVIIDMKNKKIAGFVNRDTFYKNAKYELETSTRFFTMDRFSEKYIELTPYQYAANNPILYIDVNGDSISVANEHRDNFNSDLQAAFGDKAKNFSFNKTGKLQYNGSKKDFKGSEKKAFKGLNKLMGEETTTNVVYGESIEIAGKTIEANGEGGALTILASENNGVINENFILINPNVPQEMSIATGLIFTANGISTKFESISNNRSVSLFHEFGHIINNGKDQTRVLDYDNTVRSIQKALQPDGTYKNTPLKKRPVPDLTHSKTNTTISY